MSAATANLRRWLKAKNAMSKDSGGFLGVPFTVVEKDDGSQETVVGFDKGKLEKVLDIS